MPDAYRPLIEVDQFSSARQRKNEDVGFTVPNWRSTLRRLCLRAVILLSVAFAGCATDKALEPKRLGSIAALTVVRYETPTIQRHSEGTIVGGGLLLGGFGMEAVAGSAGAELAERCKLEDFGVLVVGEFATKAPKQIPTWPPMNVQVRPVEPTYSAKDAYVISIQPIAVWLYSFGAAKGLNTSAMATFVAPGGEVIWRRQAFYSQKQANRERELADLEANNCKLLKEEMQHAAGVIAEDFVADLRRQQ